MSSLDTAAASLQTRDTCAIEQEKFPNTQRDLGTVFLVSADVGVVKALGFKVYYFGSLKLYLQ